MTKTNVLEVSFENSSEQTLEDTMNDLITLSDSMTTPAGKKTIEAAIEAIAEEQRRRAAKPVLDSGRCVVCDRCLWRTCATQWRDGADVYRVDA